MQLYHKKKYTLIVYDYENDTISQFVEYCGEDEKKSGKKSAVMAFMKKHGFGKNCTYILTQNPVPYSYYKNRHGEWN